MPKTVDLNADMGESFGDWVMGNDAALLDIVTSANIACGFHAGDPNVMSKTMRLAHDKGVGLGVHPGFSDLEGFGRRRLNLPEASLRNLITYQIGAAQAMAASVGGSLNHLKLHGALANMASEDHAMARICFEAVLDAAPDLIIMVLAGTAMQEVVTELGCKWAGEIFAAVIHDASTAATRILKMVKADAIIAASGKKIPVPIDTICMHGDTQNAITIAASVKALLENSGVTVRKLSSQKT